jgi:hypothetical protein
VSDEGVCRRTATGRDYIGARRQSEAYTVKAGSRLLKSWTESNTSVTIKRSLSMSGIRGAVVVSLSLRKSGG